MRTYSQFVEVDQRALSGKNNSIISKFDRKKSVKIFEKFFNHVIIYDVLKIAGLKIHKI